MLFPQASRGRGKFKPETANSAVERKQRETLLGVGIAFAWSNRVHRFWKNPPQTCQTGSREAQGKGGGASRAGTALRLSSLRGTFSGSSLGGKARGLFRWSQASSTRVSKSPEGGWTWPYRCCTGAAVCNGCRCWFFRCLVPAEKESGGRGGGVRKRVCRTPDSVCCNLDRLRTIRILWLVEACVCFPRPPPFSFLE